jgi:hypothetical protein
MATTGELRAIMEELSLVDIGEAASYLGEEIVADDNPFLPQAEVSPFIDPLITKKSEVEGVRR